MPLDEDQPVIEWDSVLRMIPGYDPFKESDYFYFDEKTAYKAVYFMENYCKHVKGEWSGKPILLEDWQRAIIGNIFGWKDKSTDLRRYREVLIYLPRKNGKSLISSGIALFLLYCDDENGAEVYCVAAEAEQAKTLWDVAKFSVLNEPILDESSEVYQKSIVYNQINTFKTLTSDAKSKHGLNAHGVIADEVHAHKSRELIDTMTTSVASRRQPLIVYATTADYDRPSICNEIHDIGCKVRDGVLNMPKFLPVIYEALPGDDWTDPEVHARANPNLGISVKRDYIESECKKAQATPNYENTFKRLHLNIKTESDVKWITNSVWNACGEPFDIKELRGRACFCGLDLGVVSDFSWFAMIFPPIHPDETTKVIHKVWLPRDTVEDLRIKGRDFYHEWMVDGHLTATSGNTADYDQIRKDINDLGDMYKIQEIAIDRFQANHIINQLTGDGFEVVPFGQGFVSMSAPSKQFEKMLVEKSICHGGHPILKYCAGSVMIETDGPGNIKPSKSKSGGKIDGIVATVMALARSMSEEVNKTSVYSSRGIRTI